MRALLNSVERLFCALPRRCALAVGGGLGWLLYAGVRYRRRDACTALARAFPENSPAERRRILRDMYIHFGRTIAEMLCLGAEPPDQLKRRMVWRNREHLDRALAGGRGALVLSAHTGNWEMGITMLPMHGYRAGVVVKAIRNRAVREHITRIRTTFGLKEFPARGSYRACLRALRDGEIVAFVLDQNMIREEGVFVEFFGQPACTTPGLAHLAAVSGAPVVPVFLERQNDGCHVYHCYPALPPPPDRQPQTLTAATQTYTRIIEQFVRDHPEQWIWIHRRWKTRPKDGIARYPMESEAERWTASDRSD